MSHARKQERKEGKSSEVKRITPHRKVFCLTVPEQFDISICNYIQVEQHNPVYKAYLTKTKMTKQ